MENPQTLLRTYRRGLKILSKKLSTALPLELRKYRSRYLITNYLWQLSKLLNVVSRVTSKFVPNIITSLTVILKKSFSRYYILLNYASVSCDRSLHNYVQCSILIGR